MDEQTEIEQFAYDYLPQVTPYVRIPSISAQGKGIDATVAWLVNAFTELGAEEVTPWHDQGGNPVVFASFKGNSDRTVLFYNHYDVQPPEPLAEWLSAPFEPTERDGKIYARGISDDKGELMSRLTVLRYMKDHGGFPVNMKFAVEGEEEIGSVHVDKYVHAHAAELEADVCIWEGGGKNEADHFQITAGLKGIVSFDVSVRTAEADIHSSMAAFVDNAAWRLVEAVSSLRDPVTKKVRVAGFYDAVQPLDADTQAAVAAMDFDGPAIRDTFGIHRPFTTADPNTARINEPTITINGLSSGYEGDGIKTIIPKTARAKMDCRLVPGQDPRTIFDLIRRQLDANGFGDVELHFNIAEDAFRSNIHDPYVQAARTVAQTVYGADNVRFVPNMSGSGPAKQFVDDLNVPIVMVGVGYAAAGAHAPNESLRIADYKQGTYYMIELLRKFGEV